MPVLVGLETFYLVGRMSFQIQGMDLRLNYMGLLCTVSYPQDVQMVWFSFFPVVHLQRVKRRLTRTST